MNKIKLKYPLLVEGNYDKNRVSAVAEGTIIPCGGFSVFNSEEKKTLLRRITESGKLLILTDSDGAGMLIRNKLKGTLVAENVINIYTPQIEGKEKRKKAPSKAGLLGVEGMSDQLLYSLLLPYAEGGSDKEVTPITSALLYSLRLTGFDNSTERRAALCKAARLPEALSAKAFKEAINILGGQEYLNELLKETDL